MKSMAEAIDELLARTTFNDDGCWVWNGGATTAGYGEIRFDGAYHYTHRLAVEYFIAPIPREMRPDHLCCNPRCWRLDHIEVVTHGENIRRGFAATGNPATCRNGHAWDGNRRQSHRGNGKIFSQCRACERISWARRRQQYNEWQSATEGT